MSRRAFAAAAVLGAGALVLAAQASAAMLAPSALKGKRVLFVTGPARPGKADDDPLVKRHLEALGLVVRTAPENVSAAAARGEDLVVISSTANAEVLRGTFAHARVPVFTWDTFDYPYLMMTGPRLHRDFGVINPTQFYARSFSVLYGYGANTTSGISRAVGLKPQLFGTLYLEPQTAGWGRPSSAGTVVADFEGNRHEAGLFTYEKGATMYDGFVAPARRVGFYLASGNFHLLTAAYGPAARDPQLRAWYIGLKLFDAALRWALSPPPTPRPYDPKALAARLSRAAHGKTVLFVERIDGAEGSEADAHMVAHLRALGFKVRIADQMAPQSVARGADLVIISATCSKYKLSNKYRDVAVPVLDLEGLLADTLHLAGRKRYRDYGEHGEEKESDDPPTSYLDIVGAWSSMAAGLQPGPVKFTKHPGVVKWAVPTTDAVVVATLPHAQHERAIFGYRKGAQMAGGFVAPARRVLFPLDNPAFDDLTPQGLALFDAAVLWAIAGPAH